MLNTPAGNRTLRGSEAELIRGSAEILVDMMRSAVEYGERPMRSGVTLFDRLQLSQQIAMLYHACQILLTDDATQIESSSEFDATLMVLYEHVGFLVETEINLEDDAYYGGCQTRSLILDAISTPVGDESADYNQLDLPDPFEPSLEEWEDLIHLLADRVLWDRDFEMVDLFADADPDLANQHKELLGITTNYYVTPAPEVPPAKQLEMLDSLARLLDR